jgi:hypothetical protein
MKVLPVVGRICAACRFVTHVRCAAAGPPLLNRAGVANEVEEVRDRPRRVRWRVARWRKETVGNIAPILFEGLGPGAADKSFWRRRRG